MIKKLATLLIAFISLTFASFAQTDKPIPELATATKLYEAEQYSQALYWYKKAATKGNTEAMEMLIEMYLDGTGTPVNPKMATQWQDKLDKINAKAEKEEADKEKKSKKHSSAKDEEDEEKLPYNKNDNAPE